VLCEETKAWRESIEMVEPSGGTRNVGVGSRSTRAHFHPQIFSLYEKAMTMPRRRTDPTRTPLQHMLDVMNNPAEPPARRDKMAVAAAPYCHQRAELLPKKVRQAAEAKKAGKGTEWGSDLLPDVRQRAARDH
jgi:hypothetical protein